LYLSPKVL